MKNEPKPFRQQKTHKHKGIQLYENIINTKPIKSPSPDKRSSNVIVNTRSPYIVEQGHRYFEIMADQTTNQNKQDRTPLKQDHRSKYQTDSKTHIKAQRSQDMPSEFQIRMSSRLKENYQSKTGELDYLRLLKEKEQTIKELRDLLELIDKSSSGEYEENQKIKLLERKLKEYSKQVKVLEIQNQCLISVIENNHVNLPSNKEEILQREIRQLRQSLSLVEQTGTEELQQAQKRISALEIDNKELERECDKLLKLMRERDNIEKRQSGSSSHTLIPKDKEKITLSKIKEQYNQNLKLAQENFENQYRDCFETFKRVIDKESKRIDYYLLRIQDLEQALKTSKQKPKRAIVPENLHHQEIESLLFEKYTKYMKELDEEKKVNEKLNLELSIAWKSLRELEMKSFNSSQDMFNESQSEEMSERNSTLKIKIKELESANLILKKSLEELADLKSREIHQLQEKMETIIDVYESKLKTDKQLLVKKTNQFEILMSQVTERENRSREEESEKEKVIQQKIKAIIETFQKQADIYRESLQQRAKVIDNLQEQNQFLRNQLEHSLNLKDKQTDISKFSENDKLVESLQSELKTIKAKLHENQEKIINIEDEKRYFEIGYKRLQKDIEDLRESSQIKLELVIQENKNCTQQLSQRLKEVESIKRQNKQLSLQFEEKNQMIDELKQKNLLIQGEQEEKDRYIDELKLANLKINDQTFEEELKLLKKSILDFFMKYKEQSKGKNLENYYTIEALYENKIDENTKLHQQIADLKDSLNKEQRQKTRLLEKIGNLQKNVVIYEQQLKERRMLYESLIKQKSRIQKQIILTKKIKDTHNDDQNISGSVNVITNQIDKLVELQRNRNTSISRLFIIQKR